MIVVQNWVENGCVLAGMKVGVYVASTLLDVSTRLGGEWVRLSWYASVSISP